LKKLLSLTVQTAVGILKKKWSRRIENGGLSRKLCVALLKTVFLSVLLQFDLHHLLYHDCLKDNDKSRPHAFSVFGENHREKPCRRSNIIFPAIQKTQEITHKAGRLRDEKMADCDVSVLCSAYGLHRQVPDGNRRPPRRVAEVGAQSPERKMQVYRQ